MKKKLWYLTIGCLTLSNMYGVAWNGFYIRSDLALMGQGYSITTNSSLGLMKDGQTQRTGYLGLAGGWGHTFKDNIYVGTDVTLLGLSAVIVSDINTQASVLYDPKATLRLGYVEGNLMVYAGAGVGLLTSMTDVNKLQGNHKNYPLNASKKADLLFTFHGRVGVDFRINGNLTAGIFYEYERSIANDNPGRPGYKDLSLIMDKVAFTLGYQM